MPQHKTIDLPAATRAGEMQPASFDPADNSIEVCFTTGAGVQRMSWLDGPYMEELQVDDASVRLGRLNAGAAFLDSHDARELESVLGSVVPGSARIDGGKGFARVMLSTAPGDADVIAKIRAGIIRNVSVGYYRHKIVKTESDDGTLPVWRVVDWEPFEISAVAVAADPGSQIRSNPRHEPVRVPCIAVRGDEPTSPAAAAANNGDLGMSNAANPAATNGDQNENRAAPPADQEAVIRAAQDAVTAERNRVAEISTIAARHGLVDFGTEHVRAGTTVDAFRSALLDKLAAHSDGAGPRGTASASIGVTDVEKRAAAIEDALLHRYDPRHKLSDAGREFRGMSLLEIGRDFLEAAGVRTRGLSRHDVAGLMLGIPTDAAASRAGGMMTTSDFPNILANVANRTLRQGYEAAGQTFRPLVRETTVPDFKPVTRTQLGEAPQLEKVNEHGEFRRGKMSDGGETYKIATYGKVVAITRQVIINDDLNAFTRIPRAFGVAAANLESDLVWGIITGNPNMADGNALFHATHKNLAASGAVISVTSIGAGRQAMRVQTGLDGKTLINVMPTYLVGPTALQTTIEQFLTSITPAQISNAVPEQLRQLVPITEPRLDVASATAWYLAADTNQIDTIELAYLEGQQGLYSETRVGFDVDGLEVKARLDVGAKAIDWRGLYKNPGA